MTLSGFHYGETSEHTAALDYNPNLVADARTNDARLPWRNRARLEAASGGGAARCRRRSDRPSLPRAVERAGARHGHAAAAARAGQRGESQRFVLPALREGYARARRAARDNGTADGGWLCVPRALSLISLDGVIPADEEIFLPDRVHLNFKGTKKLADYVADHLSKCAARNALA